MLFRAPTLPGAHPMLLLADPCSCCSGMLVLTPRPCLQCPSSLATFSSTARPVAYGRRRPPPPSPHLRPRYFHPHHRRRHCRLRRRPHHHHPRRRRTARGGRRGKKRGQRAALQVLCGRRVDESHGSLALSPSSNRCCAAALRGCTVWRYAGMRLLACRLFDTSRSSESVEIT